MNKKIVLVIVFCFSIISISIGLYINNLSKPKNILKESIFFIHNQGKKYLLSDEILYVGDNYTSKSSIDFNLNSEYYLRDSKSNEDSLKKYNFIKNISNMNTNLLIKQDVKNEIKYMELSQKIGDEDIFGYKRLIDNSTEYYFINGILNNYVNNGTCNYFESLSEENTTRSNAIYLYDFIFNSLQNNMKDEYFDSYDIIESINSKNINVHKITIKFNNKNVREILNNILKDLKNDKKANNILSSVYSDFNKYKVKDKINFFSKDEYYELSIYTSKFLCKPLKYELIHMNGDVKEKHIIEKNNNSFDYYYLENDSVSYNVNVVVNDNSILGKIYNSSSKEIGEFLLEIKDNNKYFNYTFDDSINKIGLKYSSKYDKVKNNTSYVNTKILDINYLVNKEIKLSGNVKFINEVSNKVKIDEDVNSPILYSKLDEEVKNKINNKFNDVKTRLER